MKQFEDISEAINGFPLDKVIVIDTETTGLDYCGSDEILSIGICDGYGNRLLDTFVRPTRRKRWDEAQAINGISPQMVASRPTINAFRDQIRDLIYGNNLIVGYNLYFDLSFITKQCKFDERPRRTFDVMHEYSRVHGRRSPYGGRKYSKLTECTKFYGYSYRAHHSINDAIATAHCYRGLLTDIPYLNMRLSEIIDELQLVKLEQRKATTQEILNLVDNGMTEVNGLLKVGTVASEKNKGKPRYEAYAKGKCIGVTSPHVVSQIQKLYMLDDNDSIPNDIPCILSLTAAENRASCSARITDKGAFADAIISQATKEKAPISSLKTANIQHAKKDTSTTRHTADSGNNETKGSVISPKSNEIRKDTVSAKNNGAGQRTAASSTVNETTQHMMNSGDSKTRKRLLFLVCLFTGFFGIHRFIMRKYFSGLIYFFTFGLFGIGWIVDAIRLGRNWLKADM